MSKLFQVSVSCKLWVIADDREDAKLAIEGGIFTKTKSVKFEVAARPALVTELPNKANAVNSFRESFLKDLQD